MDLSVGRSSRSIQLASRPFHDRRGRGDSLMATDSSSRNDLRLIPPRRLVAVLLSVSLLPLGLLGVSSWVIFGRLLNQKSLELQSTIVEGHAKAIDLYIEERVRALGFLIDARTVEESTSEPVLKGILTHLNRSYEDAFVDIGIIDSEGKHLAYFGPYDLKIRNYREAEWFQTVQKERIYVSDVFLGYRRVPHVVIAVRADRPGGFWFLRVTINSEQFESIVHTDYLGTTGEAFIVNRQGRFQTGSRTGPVMEMSPLVSPAWHTGVRNSRLEVGGVTKFQATSWLNNDRWMLVVQQDEIEVRQPVHEAMFYGGLLISAAMLVVVVTTLLATGYLEREIGRANKRREEIQTAFMRSAQLASIGELATGFAHEINNPLAIISAEQTNIKDLVEGLGSDEALGRELLDSVRRCEKQVKRCGGITLKMLQFGRRGASELRAVKLIVPLEETVRLMRKQAELRSIQLILEVEAELPLVQVVSVELEQVLVNLINNALHAIKQDGEIRIEALRKLDEVLILVQDNGCGIPAEHLDRIFEPFFTTKPVGQGTGLGLSVCYGMVHSWGGRITAESTLGQGTTFTIRLPINSTPD